MTAKIRNVDKIALFLRNKLTKFSIVTPPNKLWTSEHILQALKSL